MNALYALVAVVVLYLMVSLGIGGADLEFLFGVIVPYAAIALFVIGFTYRILKWARSAVPFCITTSCGQQKSLAFIKSENLENPHNLLGVLGRLALEVLCFRSLFRNTQAKLTDDQELVYGRDKWLWAVSLAFHWSFLIILIRHARFFSEPVPAFVLAVQSIDGFFKIGVPILFMTGLVLLASATFLFARRLVSHISRWSRITSRYC